MARAKKFRWGATALGVLVVLAAIALWVAPSRQTSSAQETAHSEAPLISRGYTDAPAGTAVVAGDPAGGSNILELRIKDGQKVTRDEIIAVLSNYPKADLALRMAEADLTKLKQTRDTVLHGTRVEQLKLQEASLKSSEEENKLKSLERARSPKPLDQRELEAKLAEQSLEQTRANLELSKQTLANEQAQMEIDIANTEARIDNARRTREEALVRTPLNGLVVQIFARQGERVSPAGIAKIVDMSQLRVLADVDELHIARIQPGGKVEITFRGNSTVYKGTIARVAPTVKRMQRVEPDGASSTDARVVQVEIEFDDPSTMPQVLGRETRVTFL
ncbi:MAG: efflux RND transporter periplasmic adaptor subunit [Alphaproteobacteria bacterium]|nr:efflux RND transporter periplasmic adaptor subunit [Alphaproteobacteria bacterium]